MYLVEEQSPCYPNAVSINKSYQLELGQNYNESFKIESHTRNNTQNKNNINFILFLLSISLLKEITHYIK